MQLDPTIVSIAACAIFTAFTGGSGVTIIALGAALYPALTKAGYSERFSLGLITSAGCLGLLFAPSLPLIREIMGDTSLEQVIAGKFADYLPDMPSLPAESRSVPSASKKEQ